MDAKRKGNGSYQGRVSDGDEKEGMLEERKEHGCKKC